jgi:hypothetical protein
MKTDSKINRLRDLRSAKPFRPFTIRLRGGQAIPIEERLKLGFNWERTRAITFDQSHFRHVLSGDDIEEILVENRDGK